MFFPGNNSEFSKADRLLVREVFNQTGHEPGGRRRVSGLDEAVAVTQCGFGVTCCSPESRRIRRSWWLLHSGYAVSPLPGDWSSPRSHRTHHARARLIAEQLGRQRVVIVPSLEEANVIPLLALRFLPIFGHRVNTLRLSRLPSGFFLTQRKINSLKTSIAIRPLTEAWFFTPCC